MMLNSEITVPVPPAGELVSLQPFLDQLDEGGTLVLNKGKYLLSEPIVVSKFVHIVGKGATKTLVQGDKFEFLLQAVGVAKLVVNGVGFAATGRLKSNVFVFNGGELDVDDCSFSGAKSIGNVKEGNGHGAAISSNKRVNISHCSFHNNDQDGLALGELTVAKITDSSFSNNYYGLRISEKSSAYLGKCDINDNSFGGVCSVSTGLVWLNGSAVRRNAIGVEVLEKAHVEIKDCEIFDNQQGVFISDRSKCVAEKNQIHNNLQPITLAEYGDGTFSHNQIFENTQTGVSINGNSRSVFRFNVIYDNEFFDIGLADNAEAVFTKNSFSDGHKEESVFFLLAGPSKCEIRENFFYTTARPVFYVNEAAFMEGIEFSGNYNSGKKEIFLEEFAAENEVVKLYLMTILSPEEKEREKEKKLKSQTHKNINKVANKSFTVEEWREFNESLDRNFTPEFVYKNVELSVNKDNKRFVLFKKVNRDKE